MLYFIPICLQSQYYLCKYSKETDDSAGKECACSAGDTGDEGLIPGLGRSPGEGNGNLSNILWIEEHGGLQSNGS